MGYEFKVGQGAEKRVVKPRHAPAPEDDVHIPPFGFPSLWLAGNRSVWQPSDFGCLFQTLHGLGRKEVVSKGRDKQAKDVWLSHQFEHSHPWSREVAGMVSDPREESLGKDHLGDLHRLDRIAKR